MLCSSHCDYKKWELTVNLPKSIRIFEKFMGLCLCEKKFWTHEGAINCMAIAWRGPLHYYEGQLLDILGSGQLVNLYHLQ